MIEDKLDELELKLSYACYDVVILKEMDDVWRVFFELKELIIKEKGSGK